MLNIMGRREFLMMTNKPFSFVLFISVLQAIFVRVEGANCDPVYYDPVSNCLNHALRIGYYSSPNCGSLHQLTDSDSKPNAYYARLNHPATYISNGQTKYYEYSAGSHLSIKLTRHALIHGIALQGSPNGLRYYLSSFQISSQTTVHNLDVTQSPTTNSDFYRESGEIKEFTGNMQSTKKFTIAQPFYANEILVYPLLFHGDRVFRVELYGCFLGKISVPSIIGVGYSAAFSFVRGQSSSASSYQYYLHIKEPNGTQDLLSMNPSANYSFLSRGKSTLTLGVKLGAGWIDADQTIVTVQGPIIGLQMKISYSTVSVYKAKENEYLQFRLEESEQPYQIKIVSFAFGDGTNCLYNYCMKKFSHGVYTANGTASNDFYQATKHATVVSCPNSAVAVTYPSEISVSGYAIRYNGPSSPHNFTITFYALWTTTFEVRLNGSLTQTETFSGVGNTNKVIHLPNGLRPPVLYNLDFNYTDYCRETISTAKVLVDEEIDGLSLRLNQTFKEELIQAVPYYFKDKPVHIYLDVTKGTSLSCLMTIFDVISTSYTMVPVVKDRVLLTTVTFASPGDTFPNVSATCQNRNNFRVANLPTQKFDFRQIPEPLTNLSISLSSHVISTLQSLTVTFVLATGNQMNCTVNLTTAGIVATYTANDLYLVRTVLPDSSKQYSFTYSSLQYGPSHLVRVMCRNILTELSKETLLEVQIPISGVGIIAPNVGCYGATITVNSTVTAGKPVTKELLIDSVKKVERPSSVVKDNAFFINSTHYGSAGLKQININVWNTVTPTKQGASQQIRITRTITNLDLGIQFNISSSQGLLYRPYLYVPINEVVTFSAQVTPADDGYIYDWSIDGATTASTSTASSDYQFTFSSTGLWKIRLVVRGCADVSLERNLTAVGPISDFTLATVPTPETVVNETTKINAEHPVNAHCLELNFGDGSDELKNCVNNVGPHPLNCFTLGSSCSVDHVYDQGGVFTVNLTASNELFKLAKEVEITAKTCYNPIITVEGDGISLDEPGSSSAIANSKTLRSDALKYNISSVIMNCEFSSTYSITWKVFSGRDGSSYADVNRTDSSLLLSNSIFTFLRSNHELAIPCCTLPYGILSVSVGVQVTGNVLTNSFKVTKILNTFIGHTAPFAVLQNKKFRIYGYNTMVTINASSSYDPDKFAQDLSIAWYCRDTNLEPRDLSIISSFHLLNHTDTGLSQPVTGCFGRAVGRIDTLEFSKILQFNSKLLQTNHTIEITAVVSNTTSVGIRKSNESMSFLVLTKETPYLEISCTHNCGEKVDPMSRLTLDVKCHGDACAQNPAYKWTLFRDNSTHNTTMTLDSILHSFDDEKNLRMKPNVLEQGMRYTLVLRGTGIGGAFYEVVYSFETNRGPKNGTCSVNPLSGVAVFQMLRTDCSGWIDSDLPISYEVVILGDISPITLCALSLNASCAVYLPDGYKDNSTINIRIRIYDSLNMFSEVTEAVKIYSSSCDSVIYNSPADCGTNPLRIGYFSSCGEFHSLSDSSNGLNANFARLNHPAYTNSKFYEYVAGEYLEIKLARVASIHAIAMQGSPDALRYYLKSFKVWYQISKNKVADGSPADPIKTFYKESIDAKIFTGGMNTTAKFTFNNPFYSEVLRVYPLSFHGKKVFRAELYGCYLGKLNVSKPVKVSIPTNIGFTKLNVPSGSIFYLKITEPNKHSAVLDIQDTKQYTFISSGRARIELGLKYDDGWVAIDHKEVDVLGPISGLSLFSDGYSLSPYKRTTYKQVRFSVNGISDPSQITSINFNFGDSTTCTHNNCIKTLSHGLYRVSCTISNDFFHQNLKTNIISCPLVALNVNYTPPVYKGGIGVSFQGLDVNHTLSIMFFALWKTNYNAYFNGQEIVNETIAEAEGWTTKVIQLPSSLLSPSSNALIFNYTDVCGYSTTSETVFIDEKIKTLSLEVVQAFKSQLIQTVPHLFKNHPVDFNFKIENGTSVVCNVTIDEVPVNSSTNSVPQRVVSETINVSNKKFAITHNFTSSEDSNINVTCTCWNRLFYPVVHLPVTSFNVRRVPESMENFSLNVSKRALNNSETFQLFIFLEKGEDMTCNVTLNSTKIPQSYTYDQLLQTEAAASNSRKSYTIDVIAHSVTPNLLIAVTCKNVWNEFQGNVTVTVVEVAVEGLTIDLDDFLCYGSPMLIKRNVTRGSPINDIVYINGVNVSNTMTFEENTILSLDHSLYGVAGVKEISVESSNSVNSLQSPRKQVKVAMTITNIDVLMNFTLSSPQGLPQRPALTLPVADRVSFTAILTPQANGYIYNWSINGTIGESNNSFWSYSFPTVGSYIFRLSVTGCHEFVFQRNIAVISPIGNFEVKTDPSPQCVVNKNTLITITHAKHSECLELDFGDGSPNITQCQSHITLPSFNCFTNESLCTTTHVYRASGLYTIKVVASNRLFAKTVTINIAARVCVNPTFTVKGNGTKIAGLTEHYFPLQHLRSHPVLFSIPAVTINCYFSPNYSIHWQVFSLKVNSNVSKATLLTHGQEYQVSNSTILFKNDFHSIRIPCCFVHYGELIVSVELQMQGHYLIGGFKSSKLFATQIGDTELVAELVEKGHKNYAYNSTITLNASLSHDPDRYSNLTYTWYCRDLSQEPRNIFSITNLPQISRAFFMTTQESHLNYTNHSNTMQLNSSNVIPIALSATPAPVGPTVIGYIGSMNSTTAPSTKEAAGCFGVSAGILDVPNTWNQVSFNSMNLTFNRTIEFTVLVEATNPLRKRKSSANHTLTVLLPLTPIFELKCTDNCKSRLDPTHKFTLITICQSGTCATNATFVWTMEEYNHTSRRQIDLKDILYPSDEVRNFYMRPNVLTPGSNYSLVVRATAPDESYFEQRYLISVNIQPLNGTCVADPENGEAIYTTFNINCSGWIDTERPLTYEVVHFNDVLTTVVCRQHSETCQTLLPMASTSSNILYVRIRIIDNMGMFSEVYLNITMHSPRLQSSQLNEFLSSLNNITNSMDAAQYIGAVTSVLNANVANRTTQEANLKIEFRDKATQVLMRMVGSASDDVIAPLISLLAEVPNEYSFASGSASTDGLKLMTNALVSDEENIIFRDIISRSKSLLAAMGMVMKSTSVNLNPNLKVKNESNFTENPLKWTTPQGREIVLSNTMHTQSLVNMMIQRMSPAEVPVTIVTSNLGINIERSYGSKMNQTTNVLLMDGRITLPSLEDMNLNKDLTVSSVTKFTTFNSFFWHETSKLINSSLIDFEMKSLGSILGVSNTKQAILLSIPRKLERPIPFQHWTFHQAIGKEKINFHTMKIENGNSLHTEFKPMNYCIDYEIYIKFGSRPSRDNYFKNWTLPDLSTCGDVGMQQLIRANICSAYQNIASKLNQSGTVESESSINCTLMEQLELEVNSIVKSCRLYPYRVFILDTETSDGTYFFSIYEKNGTLSNITTSAELLNATTSCQLIDGVNQSSYFLRSFTSKCRFWNTISEKWEAFGCQVGDESDVARIQCKCNHLTSFASDFFVAPNPIDIDKVLEGFKNINDNVSVVVLLSLLFGLFLLLAVRLRRRDKEDASKVGVVSIQHNPTDSYQYLIITITGARVNAGTTANVYCTLNNSEMKGKPRLLIDLENPAFQRDQINAFIISYEEPIENITDMRIWHDNKGNSPSWYLSRVYIEDLTTNKTYSFICEQWLAVEFEDGLIDRSLGVASEEDNKIFTHIFTTKTAKDFSDEHLWLSLFLKRPHDSFTRVQRVACCMALLCLTMLASAMFFQLGNDSKYLWKIGSLVIDFKGIIIGIQSGLVVIPVSAIILAIFRNTESFEQYKKRRKARNHDGTTAKRGKLLPCGFLVVGWFLAMVAVLGSSVVVLFYSMQWGNEKSQQFVISIFTSFIESAFIIQPVKLVIFAMLLAAIFKRSQEEANVLEMYKFSSNVQTLDLKESGINVSNKEPKPLTEEQQESARNRRFMEIRLRLFLQELVSYLIFLIFLALVVRGYRDTDEYYFSKALRDDMVHEHFDKVRDIPAIWTWAQNHFIPAIYSQEWYNGNNFSNFKMTRNQEAYRLGLARIRQVRVRPNTCSVVDDAKGIVNRCNAGYSFDNDDERNYDVGWKNLTNSNRKRRQVEEVTTNGRQAIGQRYMLKQSEMNRKEENRKSVHGMWRLEDDLDWAAKDLRDRLKQKRKETSHHKSDNMNQIDDILPTAINFQQRNDISDIPNEYNRENEQFHETHTLGTQSKALKPNAEYDIEEDTILRRSRRALKLKIKRTTGTSFSNTEHPEVISIDEQYLLPNGKIKPNKQHWLYNDMSSLRGFPYYGRFATYSGGGYVASLSTDIDFARATVMALEQDSWVDMLTRALFFEFSVYNANMNFFATGFVIIEILPTGSVVPSANIRVFKLYRYVGTFGRLVMASEIILLLCLLFFIYKECRHMYRLGWGYFKLFWSWIEITIAVALFTALILRAFSWYEGDKNLIALRENMEQFINFHYTVVADDALLTAVMIISFFSTLKVIKIIEVFPTIVFLKGTLRRCLNPLMNYAFPFIVAFCAFAMLFHLTFYETELFMSYLDTAETQLLMLIGGSVFYTLQEAHSFLGPIFFFLFAILEMVVLMNVFLAIINDGISESAHWSEGIKADEFFEFMEERVQLMMQVFSDSIQKTISKVPLGFQKFEGSSDVSEGDSAKADFITDSKKMKGGNSIETYEIAIKRLEDKLSENFQKDRHDMKDFLILLVRLGKMKNESKNRE